MSKPKKLIILKILEILKNYTDENHRLDQKDIINILKKEYDMDVDRKTVRRNIKELRENGFDIRYTVTERKVSSKSRSESEDDNKIWSEFYIIHELEEEELRLVIDSLIFSKYISYKHCKDIVEKLEKLTSRHFKSWSKYIAGFSQNKVDNQQVLYSIKLIGEAIDKERKISFKYMEYRTDKKMYPKKCADGSDKEYIVSPYRMVANEGKYYLICNYDKYDDISNYRIDRIKEVKIIDDEPAKPFNTLKGSGGAYLDLDSYMKEHIYMYSSNSTYAKLRVVRPMVSDIIDIFGKEVRFEDKDKDSKYVNVYVKANEKAIIQFAKNYAPDVEVLEPKQLRDKVKDEIYKAWLCYE